MTCASSQHSIEAYLDGELATSESAEVREHMDGCPSCAAIYRRLEKLRNDLRTQAPRYTAPAHLQQRIHVALRKAAKSEAPRRALPWNWAAVAASVLLCASLAWNFALLRSRGPATGSLAQEVLSSHVRSLIGTHLVDVPSSDQHTVRPWFNGKLDFSPEVKDFASQGFRLVGGRVDYLGDRPVAALIYQRRQHFINLFTWPSTSSSSNGQSEVKQNGYNILNWTQNGMTYWAISDLQRSELDQFAQLYK
jgi:mycothiol system anti-sigma-R factor